MQTSKENKNKNVFCKCWQCCIKMYWLVWQAKIFTKVLTECKWGNNSCAEMLTSGDLKSGGSLFGISPLPLQDINDQLPSIKTNRLSPLFITSVWLVTLYKVLHEVQTIKICLAQKSSKVDFIREIWWPVPSGGGGGGVLPCRYVPPQRVGFAYNYANSDVNFCSADNTLFCCTIDCINLLWYRVPYCLPTKSKLSLLKYELWTFQWIICYITLVCQLLASLIYQHIFLARGRGALLLGIVTFGTNLSVKLWGGNSYHLIVQYIVYFKKDFGLLIQHVVFIFVFL